MPADSILRRIYLALFPISQLKTRGRKLGACGLHIKSVKITKIWSKRPIFDILKFLFLRQSLLKIRSPLKTLLRQKLVNKNSMTH